MRDRSDHHRCLYCDDVPAERPHRDARLPGTDTVAFREVLPYLSLEPFRRCWYTQCLVALKESASPAPAEVRQMWSIGFSICPPSGRPSVCGSSAETVSA